MKIGTLLAAAVMLLASECAVAALSTQTSPQDMAMVGAANNGQQAQDSAGKLLQLGPLFLRGTLGTEQVQASLRTKANPEEGIEGDYFLFGHSQKVLLAGEIDGSDVFMEESVNGTDVSGQWNGKLEGDIVSGTWQSADGLVTKPFTMKIVQGNSSPDDAAGTSSGQGKQ